MQREFIDKDEVAQMIGLPDGRAFLRQRARLETEAGFPAPMPTTPLPRFWRRSAIAAWLETAGTTAPAPGNWTGWGNNIALLHEARTA